MTDLLPLLYANGALRLTRHGPGRGDTVLMHVPGGFQFDVPDDETVFLVRDLEAVLLGGDTADEAWTGLRQLYRQKEIA